MSEVPLYLGIHHRNSEGGGGRNVKRFRGGLVFQARRLCVSLNSRLESSKEERRSRHDGCVCSPPPSSRTGHRPGRARLGMGVGAIGAFGSISGNVSSDRQ